MGFTHRKISIRTALVLVVLAVASTAVALTSTSLPAESLNLFTVGSGTTNFDITSYSTSVVGANQVDVTVVAKNTDSTSHFANITVQLLDAAGNVVMQQTLQTDNVAAGASKELSYSFSQTDISTTYESSFVVVKQSS